MQNIYLKNTDPTEALNLFLEKIKEVKIEKEEIETVNSLNRVTYNSVFSKISSPNFNASAMDGIAVVAIKTFNASETNKIELTKNIDFIVVDTGDPIIEPYDAVIMIEDVVYNDNANIATIIKAASPWQHIRPIGEDIIKNEMIVKSNHLIRPIDINAFISGGVFKLEVFKKIRVGIIPTGDEIIEPTDVLEIGKIIESNSRMFEALIKENNCVCNRYPICKDNIYDLKKAILKAIEENDFIIINAGSSAGREDFTSIVIKELGELLIHGISIKPGKPTALGIVNNKPIVGLPGYPVASFLMFNLFVKESLNYLYGINNIDYNIIECNITKRIISSIKNLEFVPVKLGEVKNKIVASPLNRGAGVCMSLVRADGLLKIDKNLEGYEAGDKVKVILFSQKSQIVNTLVSIGSHDLIMDIISNEMIKISNFNLSSTHVGSLGGIIALKKSETHIAPIHLLDDETGEYNKNYVKKYFNNKKMILIKGVKRLQGLIIKKGNPKNIRKLTDLVEKNLRFVNRQKGSGTRILVDYLFNDKNIDFNKINGYEREMTTHMSVAASVKSESADVGVGVFSAAKALDLDFIEIGFEDYDFLIEADFLEDEKIKCFIEILKSKKFHKILDEIGGYLYDNTGEIINI